MSGNAINEDSMVMTRRMLLVAIGCAIICSILLTAQISAQDWPQWRGPNRDGAASAFREPSAWPENLKQQWRVDVGLGYATPLVIGPRLYMFTRQGEEEVMTALDAASGKVIWRTGY